MATIPYPANVRQPIWGSGKEVTAKILKNDFGDNYTERASDGINNIKETWNVAWKNLTTAEKNIVESFLIERDGYQAFRWAPPNEAIKKYICASWKFTPTQAGYYDASATFEQVFDYT